MNPAQVALLVEKNGADIKALIDIFGIENILKAMPHLMNIMATLQAK